MTEDQAPSASAPDERGKELAKRDRQGPARVGWARTHTPATWSLGWSITASVAALLLVVYLVLYVTSSFNAHHLVWPWNLGIEHMTWPNRLRYAAAVVTGFGATVALVVNYRKQRDSELGRFAGSFADACAQLGNEAPTVRLGGAYALAALADRQSDTARRQQCIDALCAYLRLPYDPTTGDDHTTTRSVEATDDNGVKTTTTSTYRPADKEVRLTLIRLIRDHLQDPADPTTWVGHALDFTGATFDGGDFNGSHFTGETSFQGAMFPSGWVTFEGATFRGGRVNFAHTKFSGAVVIFDGATFAEGRVTFAMAEFSDGYVGFEGAEFAGGWVSFKSADFSGGEVGFVKATFSGGEVRFTWATFSGSEVVFTGAKFAGGAVDFTGADFSGGEVAFGWTMFWGSEVVFTEATFSGSKVVFTGAKFAGGAVDFTGADFSGGEVSFALTTFLGGQVTRAGRPFRGWPEPPDVDE